VPDSNSRKISKQEFTMFRNFKTTLAAMTFAVISFTAMTTRAQYFDNSAPDDWSGIYAANMQFDHQFNAALPGLCWQAAIATRGQQLPFNAMTISRSNNELSQRYASSNAAWANNSSSQMNAASNYSMGAIQGNWTYANPNGGQGYVLPYTQNSYTMQNGYIDGGYTQGGTNFYPTR
jgi:hypothetical protein